MRLLCFYHVCWYFKSGNSFFPDFLGSDFLKFRSRNRHIQYFGKCNRNQHGNPVIQHLVTSPADGDPVLSRAWSANVSQINPERDRIANFGELEFLPTPLWTIVSFWGTWSNSSESSEDELEYQTYLHRVLAESSVSVVRKMNGSSRATLLTGAWN